MRAGRRLRCARPRRKSAFEAPLEHFLDTANYQRREFHFRGRHRHYMAIPYEGRYIWGATAAMLYSFARMLASDGKQ